MKTDLSSLPIGTQTNYGKFAGMSTRTIEGKETPVATFTEPRYGGVTATPFLDHVTVERPRPVTKK